MEQLTGKSSILLRPIQLGSLLLPNRIVMAPLTRCRAHPDTLVPNELMAEYYRQRASAGLILAEATNVSPAGVGYHRTPGIWSQEQVDGWRLVTDAVHEAGGRIFLQLWHVGRCTDAEEFSRFYQGQQAVSSSDRRCAGRVYMLRPVRPYSKPRALATSELAGIVELYRHGAANALLAGFDGVELHAANGYLVDQFLQDGCNQGRRDIYGGSVQNRARLLLEVVDAIADIWGYDRVGVHLAPRCDYNDMGDSDPRALFTHVASELGRRKVAFLFLRESHGPDSLAADIKHAFKGPVIGNERKPLLPSPKDAGGALPPKETSLEEIERLIDSGQCWDAFAFGRDFIANPDLVKRVALGAAFNPPQHMATFYAPGPVGYTDYPTLEEFKKTTEEELEWKKNGDFAHGNLKVHKMMGKL